MLSLKKQVPNAAAKLPKVRLCESQTPRPFPLMRPLLIARVCGGVFSRKSCERVGESQSALSSKPCKTLPNQQQLVLRRGFHDASCMFTRLCRSYLFVIILWFGRWRMNLHKRSCCSMWVRRKVNMEFAKGKHVLFAKNGRSQIKEFWSTHIYINIYIY